MFILWKILWTNCLICELFHVFDCIYCNLLKKFKFKWFYFQNFVKNSIFTEMQLKLEKINSLSHTLFYEEENGLGNQWTHDISQLTNTICICNQIIKVAFKKVIINFFNRWRHNGMLQYMGSQSWIQLSNCTTSRINYVTLKFLWQTQSFNCQQLHKTLIK